jgi:HK97 family phage prohead protease
MSAKIIRKFVRVDNDAKLGERQIRIVASDATVDRVGDVMVPEGCDLSDYRANPIILAQHDPNQPIGKSVVEIKGGRVEALIDFPPAGLSVKADEYCGLAKHGIISAASVGFEAIESEPNKGGGRRYTKWRLLEISLVSVPANPAALVVERSATLVPKHRGEVKRVKLRGPYSYPIKTALDAWLQSEYPGLGWGEAYRAHFETIESLSDADCSKYLARKREAKRRFDEAKSKAEFEEKVEKYLFDQMSPEQQQARRAEIIAELEPPKPTFFKWDPYQSAGANIIRLRQFEWGGRR